MAELVGGEAIGARGDLGGEVRRHVNRHWAFVIGLSLLALGVGGCGAAPDSHRGGIVTLRRPRGRSGGDRALSALGLGGSLLVAAACSGAITSAHGDAPTSRAKVTTSSQRCGRTHCRVISTSNTTYAYTPVILGTVDGGRHWRAQRPPVGTKEVEGVFCTTLTECEAVGTQVLGKPGPYEELADDILWTTTDGAGWASTDPAKSQGELRGLACLDVTCLVVGLKGNLGALPPASDAIAESLETVKGIVTRSTTLPGTRRSLTSVSCTTLGVCNAVGSHYVGPASTFRGSDYSTSNAGMSWTSNALPLLPAGKNSHVQGVKSVSCSTSSDCVAVGGWISPRGFGAYAISTTDGGTKWTFDRLPYGLADLTDVSCEPDGQCVASGNGAVRTSHSEGTGNGVIITGSVRGKWHLRSVPHGNYELDGVTCVAETCFAVGVTSTSTDKIIESSDGGVRWVVQSVPAGRNFGLAAVSCVTKLVCEAVG